MNRFFCTRKLEFDAAHRVIGHEGKCKYLHGHRYVLEITFTDRAKDDLGRIVDFGLVKKLLGKWIDDNLDHNVILFEKDKELGENISRITNQNIYYLPYNPTAENIAKYIIDEICPNILSDYKDQIYKIKLYETPNCSAEILKE